MNTFQHSYMLQPSDVLKQEMGHMSAHRTRLPHAIHAGFQNLSVSAV